MSHQQEEADALSRLCRGARASAIGFAAFFIVRTWWRCQSINVQHVVCALRFSDKPSKARSTRYASTREHTRASPGGLWTRLQTQGLRTRRPSRLSSSTFPSFTNPVPSFESTYQQHWQEPIGKMPWSCNHGFSQTCGGTGGVKRRWQDVPITSSPSL